MFLWSQSCLYAYIWSYESMALYYTEFGTMGTSNSCKRLVSVLLLYYRMETQAIYATNVWVIFVKPIFHSCVAFSTSALFNTSRKHVLNILGLYWASSYMTGLLSCCVGVVLQRVCGLWMSGWELPLRVLYTTRSKSKKMNEQTKNGPAFRVVRTCYF